MLKQRGEKGKSSLLGEEALPACVRPRGVEGRLWGLTCCPHLCLLVHSPSPGAPPCPSLRSVAFTAPLYVL